jgi:hypothetical protein
MLGILGNNINYEQLEDKTLSGFYTLQKIAPDSSYNVTLQPTSTTQFRFDIPISAKAIKINSMRIKLKMNIITVATAFTSLLPSISPIATYELKTKTGQIIAQNNNCRSFNFTYPDRVDHYNKKSIFHHIIYEEEIPQVGFKNANLYGSYQAGNNYEESSVVNSISPDGLSIPLNGLAAPPVAYNMNLVWNF